MNSEKTIEEERIFYKEKFIELLSRHKENPMRIGQMVHNCIPMGWIHGVEDKDFYLAIIELLEGGRPND